MPITQQGGDMQVDHLMIPTIFRHTFCTFPTIMQLQAAVVLTGGPVTADILQHRPDQWSLRADPVRQYPHFALSTMHCYRFYVEPGLYGSGGDHNPVQRLSATLFKVSKLSSALMLNPVTQMLSVLNSGCAALAAACSAPTTSCSQTNIHTPLVTRVCRLKGTTSMHWQQQGMLLDAFNNGAA